MALKEAILDLEVQGARSPVLYFDVTVHKLADRYIAARSNEFGYANYEVEVAD